jgi:(2R)-3-sulfolactate dehydrogenase (NADP+)
MARGELMVAADEGKAIPLGWALDKRQSHHGPQSGARRHDAASRRVKRAMPALMIELLAPAHGWASRPARSLSMNKPRIGQAFLVVDPGAGGQRGLQHTDRDPALRHLQDENVSLPSYRRHDLAHRAGREGLEVSEVTMQKLGKSPPKAEFCRLGGGTVTSGPHLGNNASAKAPFGGECKNLRVEFARLRNSVRREAPL